MPKTNPTSLTDKELLDLIHTGVLDVSRDGKWVTFNGHSVAITTVGTDGVNGVRNRVEIRVAGKKRTIVLARLVYMAFTRYPIKYGFEIHHVDGDRFNDAFSNLICVTIEDHLKLHGNFKEESDEEFPF